LPPPPGSTHICPVSGGVIRLDLQSTLLEPQILDKYLDEAEKFRKKMALICLEDHVWTLRSRDVNGLAVVRMWYHECDKEIDGSGRKAGHQQYTIKNLFSNFGKSHLMSTAHVKCWCRRKGIPFELHPQSAAPKNKPAVLTNQDHRRLVQEGVCVFKSFNSAAVAGRLPFELIGDLGSADFMSFWYKVRCCFCCEFLQLYPPKNNLQANMTNHIFGTRHARCVETAEKLLTAGVQLVSTGKRGRPPNSSKTIVVSQSNLHEWFNASVGPSNNPASGRALYV
jgi:hypothetical protein